ncbi:MAG: selenocysteine-specific translation elongation factor [Chloroflexi bacterium 13_1_40CM_4_68_4]|nr:MAG: selenocysteine-specific translation elongation factor [Chloroflexi bacterium 13_1_40CM_4_68_4]
MDHGKSTLITALTGTDPDRLREERERGMTIDLGFAWMTAPSGTEIGFVDVPGHQDFIRNMLAGIGSIDAVILVIAADEGIMPQTREHLAILSLLGIERGLVALTKRDLVDDEWAALVSADVRAALGGTPLAASPIVEVSAVKRTGLDRLVATLGEVLGAAPPRRDTGRPRLPIDRAFTMTGFGTVVTGTLLDGTLGVGDEVAAIPGGARGRIRGLQTHRHPLETARPGSRVAANLTGVEKDDVARGMVLVRPGSLPATSLLTMRLVPVAGAIPLAQDEEIKVHVGTAETMARASFLEDEDALTSGGAAWIQLRLASPVAAAVGDRLGVRRPSPSETIGGGVIADVSAKRLRRRAETVAELERRAAPSPASRLLASLDEMRTAADAAERSGLDAASRDAAVAEVVADGRAVRLADALISRAGYEALAAHVERICAQAHRRTPLRAGASREEARSAVGLTPKRWTAFVERLVADGRVAERGGALALPTHVVRLGAEDEARWIKARAALAQAPLAPPSPEQLELDFGIDRELLAALAERGDVVRVGPDAAFLPDAVARFAEAVVTELETAHRITVGRARDLSGSSRKHVLPLLQYLDDEGLTRRQGDDRILLLAPDAARTRIRALTRHREDQG